MPPAHPPAGEPAKNDPGADAPHDHHAAPAGYGQPAYGDGSATANSAGPALGSSNGYGPASGSGLWHVPGHSDRPAFAYRFSAAGCLGRSLSASLGNSGRDVRQCGRQRCDRLPAVRRWLRPTCRTRTTRRNRTLGCRSAAGDATIMDRAIRLPTDMDRTARMIPTVATHHT